jgi:hypothetical protein
MSQDGVATFFCCGDNTEWEEWCNDAGQGWCNAPACGGYVCADDEYIIAYPNLESCTSTYTCYEAGCGLTVPQHRCGDSIFIHGVCADRGVICKVKDCGPDMANYFWLSSPYDCVNWQIPLVDLSPKAYFWLNGGQGDIGPIAIQVYW